MLKIDVVMVLYNKRIEDLQTLPALSSSEVVGNIILCDNSEISLHNEDALFDLGPKVCYLPMGGNLGIARAYNKAIKYVQSEYVCLFDDDTVFPSDYFEEVAKEIAKTKAHVLLPLVFAKSHLLSPCKKEKNRIRGLVEPYCFEKIENLSAINSGMVVRSSVYDDYQYNEELFLDNVDHDFMDYVRLQNISIRIMKHLVLYQDYSRDSFDKNAELKRFRIWKKDNRAYYRKQGLQGLLTSFIEEGDRRLMLAKKYKSILFLI